MERTASLIPQFVGDDGAVLCSALLFVIVLPAPVVAHSISRCRREDVCLLCLPLRFDYISPHCSVFSVFVSSSALQLRAANISSEKTTAALRLHRYFI
ncbi:hypothetical protein Nepgr_027838 [Nepenthes gracilis]|uniref:Uncharacterized protein n=1 Tax=Nepenthes gracilis TaxID=150966 RepID=A0AAD3Y3C5_NEPGR|nr:hypothetical protein Nepgr_027838 [Nepenthes gracilis]